MRVSSVIAMVVLVQLHASAWARSSSTRSMVSNKSTAANTLELLKSSRAALQQSVLSNRAMGSARSQNITLNIDGKRRASLVTLLGADVAYICWAAFSLSANSFNLLSFVTASAMDGEVEIDYLYLTQLAALVAGVQAEIADLMASIEGTVADVKGGLSIVLSL